MRERLDRTLEQLRKFLLEENRAARAEWAELFLAHKREEPEHPELVAAIRNVVRHNDLMLAFARGEYAPILEYLAESYALAERTYDLLSDPGIERHLSAAEIQAGRETRAEILLTMESLMRFRSTLERKRRRGLRIVS